MKWIIIPNHTQSSAKGERGGSCRTRDVTGTSAKGCASYKRHCDTVTSDVTGTSAKGCASYK
eukprot:156980-Prorocentrum_minimum.AAC.2